MAVGARSSPQIQPRDPGVQPERTALAWSRTGLALLANAMLVLRAGWTSESTPIVILGVLLLAACGAAFACGAWRRHRLVSGQTPLAPPALVIQAAAIVMLVAGLGGVASIWVHQQAQAQHQSAPPAGSVRS
jgi:uncharacterized membrane protein YidH (DUF202 family)